MLFRKGREPRNWARSLVFKESGEPRSAFRQWYEAVAKAAGNVDFRRWDIERTALIGSGHLAGARSLHILSTPHTTFVAHLIAAALRGSRFVVSHSQQAATRFDQDLYIVICPQFFPDLPPAEKRIVFQMEQHVSTRWFTDSYLTLLKSSLCVFDYSVDNIEFLQSLGMSYRDIFHVPIAPVPDYAAYLGEPEAPFAGREGVLFYGMTGNSRRDAILATLRLEHPIRVISKGFGRTLRDAVREVQTVLNLHHYDGALLETTRLCEALSLGASVISERGADDATNRSFSGLVQFVDTGDLVSLRTALSEMAKPQGAARQKRMEDLFFETRFMLARALHGIGALDYDELWKLVGHLPLTSDRIAVSLPETAERRRFCQSHAPEGTVLFPGLRQRTGWMGTVFSYRFLADAALEQGRHTLAMQEDDADFPEDFASRLTSVQAHLARRSDWDMFSGMLSDLDDATEILDVMQDRGITFVTVDRMIGMVYGIYRDTVLQAISEHRFFAWDDKIDAMDRYLESRRLRCVTSLPFLVGHNESLASSIWHGNNAEVGAMIRSSEAKLARKVEVFLSQRGVTPGRLNDRA